MRSTRRAVSRGWLRQRRERDDDACSLLSGSRLAHPRVAAVLAHHVAHDRQPDAASCRVTRRLPPLIRLPHTLTILRRNAASFVVISSVPSPPCCSTVVHRLISRPYFPRWSSRLTRRAQRVGCKEMRHLVIRGQPSARASASGRTRPRAWSSAATSPAASSAPHARRGRSGARAHEGRAVVSRSTFRATTRARVGGEASEPSVSSTGALRERRAQLVQMLARLRRAIGHSPSRRTVRATNESAAATASSASRMASSSAAPADHQRIGAVLRCWAARASIRRPPARRCLARPALTCSSRKRAPPARSPAARRAPHRLALRDVAGSSPVAPRRAYLRKAALSYSVAYRGVAPRGGHHL